MRPPWPKRPVGRGSASPRTPLGQQGTHPTGRELVGRSVLGILALAAVLLLLVVVVVGGLLLLVNLLLTLGLATTGLGE